MTRRDEGGSGGGWIKGLLAGLSVGAVLGLLFAPRSGEETREYLGDTAREGWEKASAKGRELGQKAQDFGRQAQETINRGKEQFSGAVEAGKQAYSEQKSKSY